MAQCRIPGVDWHDQTARVAASNSHCAHARRRQVRRTVACGAGQPWAGKRHRRKRRRPTSASAILVKRIDEEKRAVGMAAVVVQGEQVRIVTAGHTALDRATAVTPDTLFEIGSITKTFTALLLADMVNRGEVKLGRPGGEISAAGLRGLTLRDHTGAPIQLVDLATHRSGLPRLPDNMPYGTRADPYADYREQELLQYLKRREELTCKRRRQEHPQARRALRILKPWLRPARLRARTRGGSSYADLLQKRVLTRLD